MRELPEPGWAADPYGRHELRFWDGTGWTPQVSDRGTAGLDAVGGMSAGTTVPVVTAPGSGKARTVLGRRSGLVIGISAFALTGIVAGVIGFSGLPDGGSNSVTPVAGRDTAAAPEPTTAEPEPTGTEEPTMYGGPTSTSSSSSIIIITTSTSTSTSSTTTTEARVPVGAEPAAVAPTKPRSTPKQPDTSATTPRPPTPPRTSTRPPAPPPSPSPPSMPPVPALYSDCSAMHQEYPHGVGLPGARDRRNGGGGGDRVRDFAVDGLVYAANFWLDVDSDGIACEA